jgi:hypothetical protein
MMSGNRPMTDFPRNEAGLVDNFIGTAYDVVKGVYDALPEIRELHEIVEEIPGMGVAAVEAAMVPARVEILGYVDRAEDAAEAAEAAANEAKKANVMYPFTFNIAQAEYDVTVIAGRSDVTTSGLALWVEGAIEYDFTITSPTKFIINSMLDYPNGAQMGVILNARFDNIIKNFDDLADAFTVQFNSAQAVRALEFTEFLEGSALEVPVPYISGLTITRPTQTVNYLGDDYRVNPIYLPLTTTTWEADLPKMVLIGNDSLRDDLAQPAGAGDVGFSMAIPYPPSTLGSRVRNFTKGYFNPLDYGAVGDGVNPDGAAIQSCINAMPPDSVLWLPGDMVFNIAGGVAITARDIQVTGGGTLKNGPLILNRPATDGDMRCDINHIMFIGTGYVSNGIELVAGRRVTITNCVFDGLNAAVLRRSDAGQVFHNVAMVRITNNDINTVNYGLRVQHNADVNSWQYTSDCAFDNNQINIARIGHIEVDGIDGMHISGNVMFMVGYTSTDVALKAMKGNNIKIGQSDWVIIQGNNLFEAGLESILLDKAKHFSIMNNHCAWPGQRAPSDAIRLTGTSEPNGVIAGNTLSRFTRHGVSVETALDTALVTFINVFGNTIEWSAAPPSYYGEIDLSTIPHYTVYQPTNSPTTVLNTLNASIGGLTAGIRGRLVEGLRLGAKGSIGGSPAISKNVTAATGIATLSSEMGSLLSTSYAGLLQVEARASPGTAGSNMASYLLHITKQPSGAGVISVISSQGLTTGGSANHPSFTFSMVGDVLTATPVGSASGAFVFWITAIGGIGVYA